MSLVTQSIGKTQTDWNPTLTGFSSNPTGAVPEYTVNGDWVTIYYSPTANGTSNATTKTISLPYAAANTTIQTLPIRVIDSGTAAIGYVATRAGSSTLDIYPSSAGASWTASGNCRFFIGSFTYRKA